MFYSSGPSSNKLSLADLKMLFGLDQDKNARPPTIQPTSTTYRSYDT